MLTLTVVSDGSPDDIAKVESLAYNLGVNVVIGSVATPGGMVHKDVVVQPVSEVPTPVFTPVFTTPEVAEPTNG